MTAQPVLDTADSRQRSRIRVLVVDDHELICSAISGLLEQQEDLLCCGQATTLREAEQAVIKLKPDLVLLDLRLGEEDGMRLIKILKARFAKVRILVVSMLDEAFHAERALRAGAHGYVMKEAAAEEILDAIHTVMAGETFIGQRVRQMVLRRLLREPPPPPPTGLAALTKREQHILNAMSSGQTDAQIATELHLRPDTIEAYRRHIRCKLGLAAPEELAAYREQWLSGEGAFTVPAPADARQGQRPAG
jgi:DNA-binding NarL/FixJ family response regulator